MTRLAKYILILAFSFLPGAVWADEGLLPALYDVSGVARNDGLNVRQGAGVSHPVISVLAPNTHGVEIVKISKNGRWGLVGNGETSGWASMRYLARQPDQNGFDLPRPLNCFGTEPFWSLQLGQSGNELDLSGEIQQTLQTIWDGAADGRGANAYGLVLEQQAASVHAVISRNLCDDGMSDRLYGFEIYAILSGIWGSRMLSGCCSLDMQ